VNARGQPGQTPLPDSSGLKIKIWTTGQLFQAEEKNVHKATVKYFGKRLTKRSAPFHLSWVKKLHREMFGGLEMGGRVPHGGSQSWHQMASHRNEHALLAG
jgi:hypothetical protein